jgi:hypothetical protein
MPHGRILADGDQPGCHGGDFGVRQGIVGNLTVVTDGDAEVL